MGLHDDGGGHGHARGHGHVGAGHGGHAEADAGCHGVPHAGTPHWLGLHREDALPTLPPHLLLAVGLVCHFTFARSRRRPQPRHSQRHIPHIPVPTTLSQYAACAFA
jgi:hypothetical protein